MQQFFLQISIFHSKIPFMTLLLNIKITMTTSVQQNQYFNNSEKGRPIFFNLATYTPLRHRWTSHVRALISPPQTQTVPQGRNPVLKLTIVSHLKLERTFFCGRLVTFFVRNAHLHRLGALLSPSCDRCSGRTELPKVGSQRSICT